MVLSPLAAVTAGRVRLTGLATVTLGGGGVLQIGNNNQSTEFTGVISGGGSIVKIGTGRLLFSGTQSNNYTGTTEISGGTLASALGLRSTRVWVGIDRNVEPPLRHRYDTLRCAPGQAATRLADGLPSFSSTFTRARLMDCAPW